MSLTTQQQEAANKHPEALQKLIDELHNAESKCVRVCRENNVNPGEMYHLIQAAIFKYKLLINSK